MNTFVLQLRKVTKSLVLLLLMQSNAWQAMSQINLSTGGYDPNGPSRLYWPSNDPNWMVKKPSTGYQNVQIGTGYEPNYDVSYYKINQNVGWLTPYPFSSTGSSPYQHDAGDITLQNSSNDGEYIYRMSFQMNYPACQKPTSMYLYVKTLTALDKVDKVYLNGHYLGAMSTFYTSLWTNTTSTATNSFSEYAIDMYGEGYPYNFNYTNSNMPAYYIYNLNPNYFLNGTNYIYFTTTKPISNTAHSGPGSNGFMCEAYLYYTMGYADYPTIDITGTPRYPCGIQPFIKYKLVNNTSSSATYTVKIYNSLTSTTPFYTNTSVNANAQVTVNVSLPNVTNFKIVATKNGSGCSNVTATRTLSMYPCGIRTFSFNNPPNGNRFSLTASPDDPDGEAEIAGFETAWKLEELDPTTYEPIYTIFDPGSCWHPAGGTCSFTGFDPNNSFHGDIRNFDCSATTGDGQFFGDRIYRITREYRSDAEPEWQSYNVVIGGYSEDGMLDPDNQMQGIAHPALSKTETTRQQAVAAGTGSVNGLSNPSIHVYPNPSSGMINVVTGNVNAKSIRVFDITGKLVVEAKPAEGKTTSIDLSAQPKGIYMIQVVGEGSTYTERVLRK